MANHPPASADGGGPETPIPVAAKGSGRLGRAWNALCAFAKTFMLLLSTIGTALALGYLYLYLWDIHLWGYGLPWGWREPGTAWIGGLVMLVIYVITKLPHLLAQSPADEVGLVREVLLGIVNIVIVVVFLTSLAYGKPSPANAVGISIAHLIAYVVLIGMHIVWAMRLTARTWTDQPAS